MNKVLSSYYTNKMAFSIIFDIKQSDFKYNEIYFDLILMDYVENAVKELTKNNFLSVKIKNNIKNYLQQAREYKDDKRSQRIEIINNIIGLLNSQENDYSLGLYIYELIRRRNSNKYLFSSNNNIKSEIDKIHESIVNDYLIITTHLDNMSDETFEKYFIEKFVKSETYYENLNVILSEMPVLFTIPTFYNRVIDVLEMKKFFGESDTKLSNKVKKKITKLKK